MLRVAAVAAATHGCAAAPVVEAAVQAVMAAGARRSRRRPASAPRRSGSEARPVAERAPAVRLERAGHNWSSQGHSLSSRSLPAAKSSAVAAAPAPVVSASHVRGSSPAARQLGIWARAARQIAGRTCSAAFAKAAFALLHPADLGNDRLQHGRPVAAWSSGCTRRRLNQGDNVVSTLTALRALRMVWNRCNARTCRLPSAFAPQYF